MLSVEKEKSHNIKLTQHIYHYTTTNTPTRMPGPDPGERTVLVETLTRNFCKKTNKNYADWLIGRGGAKIKRLFPTQLANYTPQQIGSSLETIKAQVAKSSAMNTNNFNTENTNNNNNNNDTNNNDTKMESPDVAYYNQPPVESDDEAQPDMYTPTKRYRPNSPTSQRETDMPRWTPKLDNSARKTIRANRSTQRTPPRSPQRSPQRNDDTSTADLTSRFESATVSMPELRSADSIITTSHVPQNVMETVTDKHTFMERARIAATNDESLKIVDNIRVEENSLDRLMIEHGIEETNRDKDIKIVDNKMKRVTKAIEDIDRQRAEYVSELKSLKEEKEKKSTEKRFVLAKVKALHDLGKHACSTLRKCADYRLKQGDGVKKVAMELAEEHVNMQKGYLTGGVEEYEKISDIQSSVGGCPWE